MSELLDVEVRRSDWFRGTVSGSRLLIGKGTATTWQNNPSSEGKMCCLGFVCLKAGMTKDQIRDAGFISRLKRIGIVPIPESLTALMTPMKVGLSTWDIPDLIIGRINDNEKISDSQREAELIIEGKKYGINFTFVD